MYASLSDLPTMSAPSTLHMRVADAVEGLGRPAGVIHTGSFGECATRLLQLSAGAYDQFWIDSPSGRFSSSQIRAAMDLGLLQSAPAPPNIIESHFGK
jgi:hypothetical protein